MSLAKRWNQQGKVIIMSETTDEPIKMIGAMAGICWSADTSNPEKNYKRGIDCIESGHGRTMEYPQIYMVLDGWSARVIRELGRHVGGMPTYLQESTRYVNYKDFKYYIPESIESNEKAKQRYEYCMSVITDTMKVLEEECNIKREDAANLLPLGMKTKIVYRTNLRALIDMAKVRKCNRAYHEFRELFKEIEKGLSFYSDEWKYLIEEKHIFKKKCEETGFCTEKNSCGYMPKGS